MNTPSQGHLFNFNSAKCKNRGSCRGGLRLDSFHEKAPGAQNHAARPDRWLSSSARGKREENEAASKVLPSLLFSLLLSPSLALSLCIPFYSISFLSLLPCPALPSGIIFILFLLPQGPVCPNSLAWAKLAFWSSWFQAPQVSQTFLGIALLSHSHFYPLPLPQVPDTENVTMRFLRSIRLSGRWVVGTAFLHAPSSSQIRLLLLELYNSWQGSGWADRWYLPGLVFWTNQFLIFWSLFKKINAQVSLSISDLWSPQPPPHWPYYSWGSEKENLFYQGFQGWAKSPRGCWGWRDVSRFMPIGVRKVPLFDLVSNQSIWIVSINMAINMLMELPIQLIHYA